jgi:hypothetical protein
MSEKPLLGQSDIESTLQKNKEFLEKLEKKYPGLGVHEMTFENPEIEFDQNDGEPKLKFELHDETTMGFKDNWKLGGPTDAARIGREQFIDFFNRCFDIQVPECKTHEDILRFAKKYAGKKIKVATKEQEILKQVKADPDNGFDAEMCIGTIVKPWYYGKATEDMSYNIKKAHKSLSAKDLKTYEALVVERGGKPLRTATEIYAERKLIKNATPVVEKEKDDDLPF